MGYDMLDHVLADQCLFGSIPCRDRAQLPGFKGIGPAFHLPRAALEQYDWEGWRRAEAEAAEVIDLKPFQGYKAEMEFQLRGFLARTRRASTGSAARP
jgi:hypothetical protein